MTESIKVDIWVDIVCPFCYIATSRFEVAVSQVAVPVDIEYHSFQLMPDLPEDYEGSNAEFFRDYRGIPPEELEERSRPLIRMTAEAALPYRLRDIQQASTLKAHQLLHHAKARGRQVDAAAALYRAHFAEGKHIGHLDVLLAIAEGLGLDRADVERSLVSEQHLGDVRADTDRAGQLGIQVVPFFVFENTYSLSGAQEIETLVDVLTQMRNEATTAGA
ncbi:putative dithiol-disulfide isomerase, DsbA family [Promicromonospora umidemergens]|uniref:DsbA family oxidoreductase n=1 Tax=Promicromonospora umidemergens TaxID=629679 RepID=A0ABP8YAZ0_9MICO|nr:DsbA family oxidoreductase [Promicromonospora umidemergens]MCP2282243.1 putative dithiol-disulfide isomerase, DsbA family [Promicromonospora umidemergens]